MAYGFGSVYQRKNGTWVAAVETAPIGQPRRRRCFTGSTREIVEAKLSAYRAEHPAPDWFNGASRSERLSAADGHHTDGEFYRLVRELGPACEYCGITTTTPIPGELRPTDRVRDHRTPLARGGSDDIANISVCCRRCNDIKGIRTAEEFLAWQRRDS